MYQRVKDIADEFGRQLAQQNTSSHELWLLAKGVQLIIDQLDEGRGNLALGLQWLRNRIDCGEYRSLAGLPDLDKAFIESASPYPGRFPAGHVWLRCLDEIRNRDDLVRFHDIVDTVWAYRCLHAR